MLNLILVKKNFETRDFFKEISKNKRIRRYFYTVYHGTHAPLARVMNEITHKIDLTFFEPMS